MQLIADIEKHVYGLSDAHQAVSALIHELAALFQSHSEPGSAGHSLAVDMRHNADKLATAALAKPDDTPVTAQPAQPSGGNSSTAPITATGADTIKAQTDREEQIKAS